MQKTKLGISVGLLGSCICFTALFGALTPTIILVGYALLMEDNEWLKRCAVKAIAVVITVSFAITIVGLVPDLLSWIGSIVRVFEGNFDYLVINSIVDVFNGAMNILRTCVLLLLGVKALNQSTITIPVVDGIISKYM